MSDACEYCGQPWDQPHNRICVMNDVARLESEIERLRAEGKRFADWIERAYGKLPREHAPGPPIQLLHEMREAFEQDR